MKLLLLLDARRREDTAAAGSGQQGPTAVGRDGLKDLLLDRDGEKTLLLLDRDGEKTLLLLNGTA